MTKNILQKPSNINIARARLDAAFVRVEKALSDKIFAESVADSNIKSSESLETEINILRSENARLKLLNEKVSKRLDGIIDQLKNHIEES